MAKCGSIIMNLNSNTLLVSDLLKHFETDKIPLENKTNTNRSFHTKRGSNKIVVVVLVLLFLLYSDCWRLLPLPSSPQMLRLPLLNVAQWTIYFLRLFLLFYQENLFLEMCATLWNSASMNISLFSSFHSCLIHCCGIHDGMSST